MILDKLKGGEWDNTPISELEEISDIIQDCLEEARNG